MSAARRGRPRDESCSAEILSAVIELVSEVGIAGLTVDAVAKRAGVGKATIYRRWSSKEALMLDAWMSIVVTPEVPDTGTLRGDLAVMFEHRKPLSDEVMRKVFPQMIAAAKVNPEVHDAYRSFILERRRPLRTVLGRARDRGELPADIDLDVVHDLLIAPLTYRLMVTDADVGDAVRHTIVEIVLAGLEARAASGV